MIRALRFDRRERLGLFLLIGGLLALYGLGTLYPPHSVSEKLPPDSPAENNQSTDFQYNKSQLKATPRPMPFDPNRIGEQGWVDRGVSRRTARTISNYLSSGGRFRGAEDLKKIWGMRKVDIERLTPWVRIPQTDRYDPVRVGSSGPFTDFRRSGNFIRQQPEKKWVDVNLADSAGWESLPGIGPGYARRILRYRDRLGGFVDPDQVAETYQLPDSVFRRIRPFLQGSSTESVRRIDLNTASIDSLGRHPYCGFQRARSILRYREQHGAFAQLEDLLDIQTVDSAWLIRMRPYLRLE